MAKCKALCEVLGTEPVQFCAVERISSSATDDDRDSILWQGMSSRWDWNDAALAPVTFQRIPCPLVAQDRDLPVGTLCVRMLPVSCQNEDFNFFVNLYNTYIAKGSEYLANAYVNYYAKNHQLCIPAMDIEMFVSTWNNTQVRFRDVMLTAPVSATRRGNRCTDKLQLCSHISDLALSRIPIDCEHLWHVLHALVSKPSAVKRVLQVVGCVSSSGGSMHKTGTVENVRISGRLRDAAARLYLVAYSAKQSSRENALHPDTGVTLGLIWVTDEDSLYDHLRNRGDCYYLLLGTEYGAKFECLGFSKWHFYNYGVFNTMTTIARRVVESHNPLSNWLAGNTAESAKYLESLN